MKKSLLQFIYACFFILSSTMMFSQGTDNGDGTLEGDDPPAAPINSKIFILVFAGIVFAIYTFRNNKKLTQ